MIGVPTEFHIVDLIVVRIFEVDEWLISRVDLPDANVLFGR